MARYRIVRDRYLGFEVQKKVWWWPLWVQVGFANTHATVENARLFAECDANPVVEELPRLAKRRVA